MYIKFLNDDKLGFKKGQVAKADESFCKRMIEEGFAEEAKEADFEAFKVSRGFAPTKKKRGRPAKTEVKEEPKKAAPKAKKAKKK